MIRTSHLPFLALAVTLAVPAAGLAQDSSLAPKTGTPAAAADDLLRSLPRLPDLPASLYAPPPASTPGANALDVLYFVPDPLLDPPQFPTPGWFAALEFDVLGPHLNNQLTNTVQNTAQVANGTSTTVMLPGAPLDWAFSPKVILGYRFPAGFGETALVYRGLGTQGSAGLAGPDGPATLHSRLDFNILDVDYVSRELTYTYLPCWTMKWTVGVRTLFLYFDSQSDQPSAQAAAGSGIVQMRETNRLAGVGPHAGLELSRRVEGTGWALMVRTDFTTDLSRLHQGYYTLSTTPEPDGHPLAGATRVANWMDAPVINAQVGVHWQPPVYPAVSFFLGYQYEYWWRVGGNLDTGARADLWDQGIVLQGAFRF